MIVVEGPDGAGKTTLIRQIVEGTGLSVAPRVVSKDAEAMVDLKRWVVRNVKRGWQNKIFDRHRLISEPIYGPLLRDQPQPGFDDPEWFSAQLYEFYRIPPVIIYCLPPFEVVWDKVSRDPDNKVVARLATMRALYGAYWNKAWTDYALCGQDVIIYDYTSDAVDTHRQAIIDTINDAVRQES